MKFIILSHTHWDREWYMPFEQFRFKLVDLIDRLLDIVQKDRRFIFHLDAQTIVLEDYVEIRPERKNLLKESIASGNIVVGPWYLQNDFYLTSGESTVRNIQIGSEIAEEYGNCARIAYAPDQFGNVSQLPQIFAGFGMNNFMFGRGYSFYDKAGMRLPAPAEFIWRAEDGSECLAVHLNQWYNNAQHIPAETDKAKLLLEINAKIFSQLNVSPYVVLMNGVDHLEPQEDVVTIAENLRAEGIDIEQCRMDDYFATLRRWQKENNAEFSVYEGALNQGRDDELLRGCWAARIHLKRDNVIAQTAIENKIEPIYAFMEKKGLAGVYPRGYTDYYWKNLLKNHPHDSICCCSRDEIARHMEDNYARLDEVAKELEKRGMKTLLRHAYFGEDDYVITVFNPTERAYTGIVEAEVRFLQSDKVQAFAVLDDSGKECAMEVAESGEALFDVFSGMNLPGVLTVDRFKIKFAAEKVPPFAFKHYAVRVKDAFTQEDETNFAIDNDFYSITWENGNINLKCKETGKTIENFIRFEDTGDSGNLYIYSPAGSPVYDEMRNVQIVENSSLVKRIQLSAILRVPEKYDYEAKRRSAAKSAIPVSCTITLLKNSRTIDLQYEIDNSAEDHRIRLMIDGAVSGETLVVDSPFDCTEVNPSDICSLAASKTFCNSTFAAKRDVKGGFALFTEGQHEVEGVESGIAVTCLRSSGRITEGAGDQWITPEGQCKRKIRGRIGFYAFKESTNADLFAYAKQFRTGLCHYYDGKDPNKFAGGRFAVQDAKLAQFYPDVDPFEGKILAGGSLFAFTDDNIAVTAVRQSLDRESVVIRLVNLSKAPVESDFTYNGQIIECNMAETKRQQLGENTVQLHFRPKEIKTLLLD